MTYMDLKPANNFHNSVFFVFYFNKPSMHYISLRFGGLLMYTSFVVDDGTSLEDFDDSRYGKGWQQSLKMGVYIRALILVQMPGNN